VYGTKTEHGGNWKRGYRFSLHALGKIPKNLHCQALAEERKRAGDGTRRAMRKGESGDLPFTSRPGALPNMGKKIRRGAFWGEGVSRKKAEQTPGVLPHGNNASPSKKSGSKKGGMRGGGLGTPSFSKKCAGPAACEPPLLKSGKVVQREQAPANPLSRRAKFDSQKEEVGPEIAPKTEKGVKIKSASFSPSAPKKEDWGGEFTENAP